MADIKRTFKQVGDKVIVKNFVEDATLSPREVINSLEDIKSNINNQVSEVAKMKTQVLQVNDNIKHLEEKQLPRMEKDLKEMLKFETWAKKFQLSKLKNLVEDIKDECFVKVTAAYNFDKTLTDEGNDLQKFAQFQNAVATHPKISEVIAQVLINDYCIVNCELVNPWK